MITAYNFTNLRIMSFVDGNQKQKNLRRFSIDVSKIDGIYVLEKEKCKIWRVMLWNG